MLIQKTQNAHISSSNKGDEPNQRPNQRPNQQQQQFTSTIKSNICNVSYFSKNDYNVHGTKTTYKTIISSHQQSIQFAESITNNIPTSWSPFDQGLRYAVDEDQGKRKHMENSTKIVDMTAMMNKYDSLIKPLSFCLFDGHLGREAATFCTEYLPKYVAEFINNNNIYDIEHIEDAIRNAFHHIDNKFKKQYAHKCQAGAVGVYAYYDTNYIYVANVGDCRAILCSNGKMKVLTEDHNTKNDMERKRCSNYIRERSELLSGEIAVTRAIGDYRKCDIRINLQYLHLILIISTILNIISIFSWNIIGLIGLIGWLFYDYMSCNQYKKLDGLICDPHIIKHKLSKDDEFLIIACDGLWDLFGREFEKQCESAMKVCRRSLRTHGNVRKAAQKLIKLAKAKSSGNSFYNKAALTSDNISVMVIGFANKDCKTGKEHIGPQY